MGQTNMDACWASYLHIVGIVYRSVNRILGRFGAFVARRPVPIVVISFVVALGCCGGLSLAGQETESDSDKLWVPQGSIWFKHEDYLSQRMGNSDLMVQLIFEAKDGQNAVSDDAIRAMFNVYEELKQVSVVKDGVELAWEKGICWPTAAGDCRFDGILKFFDYNITVFEEVAEQGRPAVAAAISATQYPTGESANLNQLYHEPQLDAAGNIESARLTYMAGSINPDADDGDVDDWSEEVEDIFDAGHTNGQPAFRDRSDIVRLHFDLPTTVDSAIRESVAGDVGLIAVAIIVTLTFVSIVFFIKDRVYTRSTLALLGNLCVALSIGGGLGLSLYFGIPFTSLSTVLPFILLGIGVDDLFVLVRSLEEVDDLHPGLELEERFRKCLMLGGMSISVTSFTNCVAFLMGSLTEIPAVRWFCWTAAISIAFDWVLQLTFFLGCFVLTEKRIEASRYDCACCLKRPAAKTLEAVERHTSSHVDSQGNPTSIIMSTFPTAPQGSIRVASARAAREVSVESKPISAFLSSRKDSRLQQLINKGIFPFTFSVPGKIAIICIIIAGCVVGGVGITKLDEGLPLASLAPDGHYMKDFDRLNTEITGNSGWAADVYFRNMDQSDPNIQLKMLDAWDRLKDAEYVSRESSPTVNWLTELRSYTAAAQPDAVNADGTVSQEQFYTALTDFLAANPIWKDDIHFFNDDEAEQIEVSSFPFNQAPKPAGDGGYERKLITDMHDEQKDLNSEVFGAENAATSGGTVLFLYSPWYKYIETDRIIFREMFMNLTFALVGIVIISVVLLIHPGAVATIILCVAIVDLFLFAEMWLFDIKLNTISVVNLTMAVGLAVDYSLHVLHTFLHTRGSSRQGRAKSAMQEIGTAVLLGLISTLLGIIFLAGSQSEIIRVFFELLMGTVIFGGFVGLFFLPVLLSLLGPRACLARMEEDGKVDGAEVKGGVAAAANADEAISGGVEP